MTDSNIQETIGGVGTSASPYGLCTQSQEVAMGGFSVFEYCYCDAGNFKSWGRLLMEGVAKPEDISALSERLESGEFFIAEQVGIPTLYQGLWKLSNGPTADDHVWHRFHDLRPATKSEIGDVLQGGLDDLLNRFRGVNAWKLESSCHAFLD